jgi:aspartyl-tRNA(Asn)/glutamyl-tRNA(Gln) amidotransferase subunit C
MAISSADVLHVAKLANLSLDDAGVDRMATQLSGILEHVDALSTLDLTGVPPTSHPLPLDNVTRPDTSRPSWPRDEVLEGAPDVADDMFRVPPTS